MNSHQRRKKERAEKKAVKEVNIVETEKSMKDIVKEVAEERPKGLAARFKSFTTIIFTKKSS